MDHGAVEAEQRRREKPPLPPPPVWLMPDDPRLDVVRRRMEVVLAKIDHAHVATVQWAETRWHTTHDDCALEGEITRWRYWEGEYGARKALGL